MKGMELPINMIVVVLIAVLVLTAVGVFLSQQFGQGSSGIDLESAFGQGCNQLRTLYNCDRNAVFRVASYTPPGNAPGSGADFFGDICRLKGIPDHDQCAIQCGCPRAMI